MKKGFIALLAGALGAMSLAGVATQAMADPSLVSGHMCTPFAPQNQNRFLRFRDGFIMNTSTDRTIKVSCPVPTVFYAETQDIVLRPSNSRNFSTNFICDLRELDLSDFVVRNTRKSVNIPANFSVGLSFDAMSRIETTNRYDLVCTMPPGTAIGLIGWE